ncbi:rRNA pseudouridine synthase [Candidatus Woesearchaeota archaeon]|jgi:23S rRNA pseudouridine2605 synthase|nr:rRNA pseudouridine synthase [Candidatus Woesearchaeota archaeon]
MHRVQKILSNRGYCSRRKAEVLIEDGRVSVNDKKITIGDQAEEDDKITVDGTEVKKVRKTYILFNKPHGCVTALTDPRYKTIMDYIRLKERVFPVGRLDYNTEGMLILTNDGDFANKVSHPSHEIKKTYLVGLTELLPENKFNMLEKGLEIDGKKVKPHKVELYEKDMVAITIHEGMNRVIRKMMLKLDLKIRFLKRIKIGRLKLGFLSTGKFRKLKPEELDLILQK